MVLSAADVLRLHGMCRFMNGEQRKHLFGGAFEAEAPRVNRRRSAHVTLAQIRLFKNKLNFSSYLGFPSRSVIEEVCSPLQMVRFATACETRLAPLLF